MKKFMLNCCTKDNSANSHSSFTFNNFDVDDNNKEIEQNNVNSNNNKEESKEEPAKEENPNDNENKPVPSSEGFTRIKTKHFK